MRRPFNETNIKKALEQMVTAYGHTDKMQEMQIKDAWQRCMGPFIIQHTRSISYQKGKLTVFVDSSVIRSEMHMVQSNIIQKLNQQLRQELVKQIEFF